MNFRIVIVGKVRNANLAAVVHEYEERAARYWPVEVHEVREESSLSNPAQVIRREGQKLLERAAGARIVACAVNGRSFASEAFAEWMQRQRESARDVAFVIGGAHGLDESVLSASAEKLALAPWTLPHEVARLILAEQLYRAGTIVRREPYHK